MLMKLLRTSERLPVGFHMHLSPTFQRLMKLHFFGVMPHLLFKFKFRRWTNDGEKNCFRAIEENAAFITLENLKLIKNLTGHIPFWSYFCGGAR